MSCRLTIMFLPLATHAFAETAGPPAPAPINTTSAAQAIALYAAEHGRRPISKPCRTPGNTITVCGTEGISPYRLPLPGERSAADAPAHGTGDASHVGVGRSPKETMPNTGLRLTLAPGKTRLKGLGAR